MRTHRLVATVGVVALSLTTAACHSKSTSSAASTTAASSAAAPSTSAAAAAAPSSAAVSSAAPATAAPASAAASSAASSAASPPAAASGSGAVTFDGDYSGKLTTIVCVGSGPTTTASFDVIFVGHPGNYTGNMGSSEFGFQDPAGSEFDSLFLSKTLDTDGKGFDVDGIVAKDESGKSVTMHGTLVCP
jgi:hypothetical protein